jgi:transposase
MFAFLIKDQPHRGSAPQARTCSLSWLHLLRSSSLRQTRAVQRTIELAKVSLVAALANGVMKDKAAVSAALSSGWSNGQAEGQICKLKLVKRKMYGRGNLDLLQARVIGAT